MRTAAIFIALLLGFTGAGEGRAAEVKIDVDTKLADRLLAISCSSQDVDEAEFSGSKLLQAQLGHHSRFGAQYSLANYLDGVRAVARCEAPDPDPFRFGALVKRRDQMKHAIRFLIERKTELGAGAAALIAPYVPAETVFHGSVVLAPATFSCGGFARDGSFFIDIPCIAEDVEGEYDAVRRLIAHETYHAIQATFMPDPAAGLTSVDTPDEAQEYLFHRLAVEGSASFVARMSGVQGEGSYARRSRDEAQRNQRRLSYNFRLFNYATELLGQPHPDFAARFKDLYGLAFDGAFGELSYHVGEQMAAEIDRAFGPAGLVCILSLPPENFILAYDKALQSGEKLKNSYAMAPVTLEAARRIGEQRKGGRALYTCL